MYVLATAGHVDHGKSTLVRALTGMEPDRWAEERRRGMTIDLGFAWTTLPDGSELAFVDVPGHERFVPNMLAGAGPVPAALLVVAADEGWMPQTAEHVAALDALGVRHAVLAVTRGDLADPADTAAVITDVRERLAETSLAGLPAVAVSAPTGLGLDALRSRLAELVSALPAPDPAAPVRLWIDRAFTIRGSGTVVTGTLGAGTLRVGDELVLGARTVQVRGLQSLGRTLDECAPVARVAVNLRNVDKDEVGRGDALLAPGRWQTSSVLDVRIETAGPVPAQLVFHLGSAAVPVRVRPLGDASLARLTLHRPVPIQAGDRALLRDPGGHRIVGRVTVLDAGPPPLTRRGAAVARARELAMDDDPAALLGRRKLLRTAELRGLGVAPPADAVPAGEWLIDASHAVELRERLAALLAAHRESGELTAGPTIEETRTALALPDRSLVLALIDAPLTLRDGRILDRSAPPPLPAPVAAAIAELAGDLAGQPFQAPEAGRLAALGLGARELAAAERAGALLRVSDSIVLLPGAEQQAVVVLSRLEQPFTTSQARQALGTSRRVALPLLDLLDRRHLTRRFPDDRREVLTGGRRRGPG